MTTANPVGRTPAFQAGFHEFESRPAHSTNTDQIWPGDTRITPARQKLAVIPGSGRRWIPILPSTGSFSDRAILRRY